MIGEIFREFFEAYLGPLPEADSAGEVVISNPFRHDPNPSVHINLANGKYNDFGSDLKGDAYAFYIEMHSVDFATAKIQVDTCVHGGAWIHPIDEAYISGWHENLMSNIPVRAYLTKERGISINIIRTYKIGWDGDRYTIPIRNAYGIAVNVRRYAPHSSGGSKMISFNEIVEGKNISGWGSNRLFPLSTLNASKEVILCEGEWDALVTQSHGFAALTATAGAGSWSKSWTSLFKNKTVYICYDADVAGKTGARKVAVALHGTAKEVYLVDLPLKGTKDDKDLTDYFVKHGYEESEFEKLLRKSLVFEPTEEDTASADDNVKLTIPLMDARQSKYKQKRVGFDVQVIGKDTAPYNIPLKVLFKCSSVGSKERLCGSCALCLSGGESEVNLPVGPIMLDYIKTTTNVQLGKLRELAGIPNACNASVMEELQSTNIEEILIAPEIPAENSWEGKANSYLVQTAYFVNKQIESNRSYHMQGMMTPDPWQQHVTFLLDEAEPLQDTVESFHMTKEVYEKLQIFQTNDVAAKFKEIHDDLSANITHIVGRDDLMTGIDLVYHSVLSFNFQGVPIKKGWIEFLCIGDTRTGKSETTEALLKHYQLGEISVAENTSYAGLVGGLQQTGDKRWFLTWGKLPLNDGRLFIIDEVSGLSIDDIARMSGIRSSGVAEITKIQTERTTARTRLIWLSNPRSGNPLSTYSYGIQAVAELIGKAEDISRFDFVVSAAKNEVPVELINQIYDPEKLPKHVYTSEICKTLILWVWSRKPEDVVFEPEAVKKILSFASRMGSRYSSQIPLVEGANQRIKLARISVAVACRVFSTDETGEKVIVKPMHVQFAFDYLNAIYQKPSLDYSGYSMGDYLDDSYTVKYREQVEELFAVYDGVSDLCVRQDYLNARTFEEQLGFPREVTAEIISRLSKMRMIRDAGGRGYKKTAGFISILREYEASKLRKLFSGEEDEFR